MRDSQRVFFCIPFCLAINLSILAEPPAHDIVQVSGPEARQPAEVSVAINPDHPEHIVAVSLQKGRPGQARVSNHSYVSLDAGRTWKSAAAPNPHRRVQGDDAVAFGLDGQVHRTYISFNGNVEDRPLRPATGIFLCSSRDGLTWSKPVPVVDHVNSIEPFEDKPFLAIDTSPDSPHRGNIYVSWTRFDVYGSKDPAHKSQIYLARSRNSGKSFEAPVRISDKPGDARDDDNTNMGAMPAVGPRGEVYVVWASAEGLMFDKSSDGGWSFGKDQVLTETPGGWNLPVPGLSRHNGLPVIAVDTSHGRDRGSIHVNWIDERNKDADVFLLTSRDAGATWSKPLRVNDDPKGNGKVQLFTWMAVDPTDGSVNIAFYDRRDQEGTLTGLTLARSTDGGKTFVNHRINQKPFRMSNKAFFGDYIGVAAHAGQVIVVYPHFVSTNELALSAARFDFEQKRNRGRTQMNTDKKNGGVQHLSNTRSGR